MALARLSLAVLAAGGVALPLSSERTAALTPEWCKSETELSAAERKARAEEQAKMDWAKKEVQELRAKNEPVSDWLREYVESDERKGRAKWGAFEAKRLKERGEEVPSWMAELEKEDQRGSDRWAACKVAEMQAAGELPPQWLVDAARRGIVDSANQKVKEIQEQIDELTTLADQESAKVDAGGDLKLADRIALASTRTQSPATIEVQGIRVERALYALKHSQGESIERWEKKKAVRDARSSAQRLLRLLEAQLQKEASD